MHNAAVTHHPVIKISGRAQHCSFSLIVQWDFVQSIRIVLLCLVISWTFGFQTKSFVHNILHRKWSHTFPLKALVIQITLGNWVLVRFLWFVNESPLANFGHGLWILATAILFSPGWGERELQQKLMIPILYNPWELSDEPEHDPNGWFLLFFWRFPWLVLGILAMALFSCEHFRSLTNEDV